MEKAQENIRDLIRSAQKGDQKARESLIESNMGLIWSIVPKFLNRGYESEDIFQLGCIGLMKAIDKFDLTRDVMFSTYAVPMIIGEIRRFLRDHGNIKISRNLKNIAYKARQTKEDIIKKTGQEPTLSELANELDISQEDLILALDSAQPVAYLDDVIHESEGNPIQRVQSLQDTSENDEQWVDIITLKDIIGSLSPRERQVIILRYFKDMTQQAIADMLGVSQVQVSRIEKKALERIRKDFK